MPSIIPGYVYTLFAALIVGTIIVSACSLATLNVKNEAVNQQLMNINQYVATQSIILLNSVAQNNQNITQALNLPASVGNQIYWLSIANDSSGAWVSSGFGSTATITQQGMYIPAQVSASGVFVSSYGHPTLQCSCVNQSISLTLSGDY